MKLLSFFHTTFFPQKLYVFLYFLRDHVIILRFRPVTLVALIRQFSIYIVAEPLQMD